ncbi:DUF4907 domain-containing protein [uncultured Lutibacter sp.]|uniref:DUF4907 domain-containing protein n=1 Tax=uncultured Lutibacter sp. TaxID=437739 RepID=UPI002628930C|nr:DUF4907 domain-containing protein [uncultured Lutibacter sp.]
MKKYVIIIVLVLLFILKFYNTFETKYHLETFKLTNGWGYKISTKNKIIIKQDIIPGITDNKPFKTEKEAKIIGELIIDKLEHNKIPSVTKKDLETKGIIFD